MHGSKVTKLSILGAIGAAVVASACCWLPLLFVGLGVSGAGLSSWFAQYRLIFLGITFIALGAAFYFTYRPIKLDSTQDETCCTVDETSPPPSPKSSASPNWIHKVNRFNRIALWPITILVLGIAFFPIYANRLLATKSNIPINVNPHVVQTLKFRIEGMDCEACAKGIQAALQDLPGVSLAEVKYPEGTASISFTTPPPANIQELIKQRAGGYRVVF